MAAKLLIAVPSKGRLKDQAAALFEGAGARLAQQGPRAGLSRHARRPRRRRGGVHLGRRDRASAQVGTRASRADRRGSDPRDAGRCRRLGRVPEAARLRPRRCGRCRARLLDRCRAHGRSRRRRRAIRERAWKAPARRHQIYESDAALLREPRRCRLSHRRERRRDRGDARGGNRRADRRHHHDRHDAARQSLEGAGGWPDPEVAGASLRLARGALDCGRHQAPRRHCRETVCIPK